VYFIHLPGIFVFQKQSLHWDSRMRLGREKKLGGGKKWRQLIFTSAYTVPITAAGLKNSNNHYINHIIW
jgi:hypothetical protein